MMLLEFENNFRDELFFKLSDSHGECVEKISKLIDELKLDNIHQQFYVFCYLLWNGYFSVDRSYVYDNKRIVDEDNTIFLGKGCCRHNSMLMEEVFDCLDINAKEFGVRIDRIKLPKLMDIKRIIQRYEEPTGLNRDECNHSVNIVDDNGAFFLFDSTNLIECEIVNKSKLVCFGGEYKVNRRAFSRELGRTSYCMTSRKPTIRVDNLVGDYEVARDICKSNHKLFDDFYDDNHANYESIRQLVLRK